MNTSFFYKYRQTESVLLYENNRNADRTDLSIVIPTYKRINLLKETILSVLEQKRPKHLNYEVVVVSNDVDFQICDLGIDFGELNIVVYGNKENIGMCGNMNKCASLATGKYVAYLQDDDLLLNNYICTVEELIDSGVMDDVGCLIPNRFIYLDENNTTSVFGKKAKIKEELKEFINKFVKIRCKQRMLQQVYPEDCYKLFYNCFAGGPTCGMVFDKTNLMNSDGFDPSYPYVFDLIFFLKFAENNKVLLYNKFLSVYRMSESASNKPEVQYDFFRGEMFLIDSMKALSSKKVDENILVKFAFNTKGKEAQELIKKDFEINRCSKLRYIYFKVTRYLKLMRSGLYRKRIINNLSVEGKC